MRSKCSWLFLLFQLRRLYNSYTDPLKNANGCQSYAEFLGYINAQCLWNLCNRDVSVCLWQFNIHYVSNSIFNGATLLDYICLLVRVTNRRYVRNHFISSIWKKTKLFSFNTTTVTFFLAVSNLPPPPPTHTHTHTPGRGERNYLLPRENFKLPYIPNQAYQDPIICAQLRLSLIHSIHEKSRDFIHGNLAHLARICASLIRPRPRGEEGNYSYLLPLSHRAWEKWQ